MRLAKFQPAIWMRPAKADVIAYRGLLERLRDHVSAYLRDWTGSEADLRAHLVKDEHWPDPACPSSARPMVSTPT